MNIDASRGGTITALTIGAEQLTRPLPDGLSLPSYLNVARRQNGVDRAMLKTMVLKVGRLRGTIVLCGLSDYAKHLVNIFGEHGAVLGIADDAPHRQGWNFRGVPVISVDEALSRLPDHFVCTRIEDRVQYLAAVTSHEDYHDQPVHCFPEPSTEEGMFYDPWKHSRFYRELRSETHTESIPGSMLSSGKIQLLVETAKQTLHLGGDVLEVGTWQGGSAWPLAKLLLAAEKPKRLVLLDFYEQLSRTNPEGVMCEDEIRDTFAFYPRAEIHAGNVDLKPEPMLSGDWCFVHYDAGFAAERLANCFDRLQVGGIIVLDNYGHIKGNPSRFDRWFENRGHVVSSPPGSEQGWVLKHRGTA
jgi:predicted O-methyltransferase YrrM